MKKIRLMFPLVLCVALLFTGSPVHAAADTTVRIMNSNVYFSDDYDTVYRMHCLAEKYIEYAPDVLCLQEARKNQTNALYPLLSDYAAVPFSSTDRSDIYQQTLYRTSELTVVECGFTRFRDKVIPWGVSWTVFERNSDMARFAVLNVHLTIISDTYDPGASNNKEGVTYRQNDCATILKTASELREKYASLPVICVGDFNATLNSASL